MQVVLSLINIMIISIVILHNGHTLVLKAESAMKTDRDKHNYSDSIPLSGPHFMTSRDNSPAHSHAEFPPKHNTSLGEMLFICINRSYF